MVKINIIKENKNIKKIIIEGHSGYGVSGNDIVCASISSIAITSINAMIKFSSDSILYKISDGLLEIEILKNTKEIDILLENMIESLEDVEKQYEKYIKIYK